MQPPNKRKPRPDVCRIGSRANNRVSASHCKRFVRVPEYDRRIGRGDDYAGDAWLDQNTGAIVYGAVGRDRNSGQPSRFREAVAIVVIGLLLAVVMTDAVVGMSSGFVPTQEAIGMIAGVDQHDQ